jgi:hypothetical protein
MANLKPLRVKVVRGKAIPPHEFIQCDCAVCRQSQESEFVVTYARVLIEIEMMVFRRAMKSTHRRIDLQVQ